MDSLKYSRLNSATYRQAEDHEAVFMLQFMPLNIEWLRKRWHTVSEFYGKGVTPEIRETNLIRKQARLDLIKEVAATMKEE